MTRPAVPRLLAGLLVTAATLLAAPVAVLPAAGAPVVATPATVPATPSVAARARAAAATATVPAAAAATPEPPATPLHVSIERLTPATIPVRGRVTLTGRVTNRSEETWTGVNAYVFTSPTPISTRAELARSAATPADAQVGVRRAAAGLYSVVGDLAPGTSRRYRLSVSRTDLGISGEPGVYWVGVHVLGAQDGERDRIADGRARAFVPLLPAPGSLAATLARTRLALIVQVRQPVRRGGAGRLVALPDWNRALAPDGRLDRLLRLSARASQPMTWVVDPAVLDAVSSVARGNPRLTAGSAGSDPAGPGPTPAGPSGSPSGGPAPPGPSASPTDEPAPSPGAVWARAWLEEFRRQAPTHTVATVPYGDLDVAATLDNPMGSLYRQATELSVATARAYGVERPVPVVDPVGGHLPEAALRAIDGQTTVLLDESALPSTLGPVVPAASVTAGARASVVLTDARAGSGGPSPNSPYAALAVRQRLLSDAALHALSPRRTDPLVVTMPDDWNPGDTRQTSGFFGGLAQPWLQMVDLPRVAAVPSGRADPGEERPTLAYSSAERAAQVPLANLAATARLIRTATTFAKILGTGDGADSVDAELAKLALLGSSVNTRAALALARRRCATTTAYLRSQMAKVHVEGPPFVMMSGESGPIQVTLVNDLEQTVTVGLAVSSPGSSLRVAALSPVTLGPGRRTSIRLEVRSDDLGVHRVVLKLTDPDGGPLGSESRFSVRTSRVSTVIWVIIWVGAALLFLASAVRLYRRVRRRRATHGPLLTRDGTRRPRDASPAAGRAATPEAEQAGREQV